MGKIHRTKTSHTVNLVINEDGTLSEDLKKVIRLGLKHFGDDPYGNNSSENVYLPDFVFYKFEKSGWDKSEGGTIKISWEDES